VFTTLVYRRLSNIHQKKAAKGALRAAYLNSSLGPGTLIPCLSDTRGKNNKAANRNLKNINTAGGSSFVIIAPTGNELAANIIANSINP
jgi:hypothetical protein